jgi:hypothetical protein
MSRFVRMWGVGLVLTAGLMTGCGGKEKPNLTKDSDPAADTSSDSKAGRGGAGAEGMPGQGTDQGQGGGAGGSDPAAGGGGTP